MADEGKGSFCRTTISTRGARGTGASRSPNSAMVVGVCQEMAETLKSRARQSDIVVLAKLN